MRIRVMVSVLAAVLAVSMLAGCGSGPSSSQAERDIAVSEIMDAIAQAYGEDYPANGEIPPEVMETEFNLTPDLYEEAQGAMAMISINNDRVVVAKAAPGKADQLEQAMQDALQRKLDDMLQYPVNIPKTNAAKVVRNGDYVAFLLVGVPDDSIQDIESNEAAEYAEAQVQIAVVAFNSVLDR